jgi:hypothetical protein
MKFNQKNAVPDGIQGSDQGLQISVRSGGMACLILLNKQMGFSQSLMRVSAAGDIVWQKPNITRLVIYLDDQQPDDIYDMNWLS